MFLKNNNEILPTSVSPTTQEAHGEIKPKACFPFWDHSVESQVQTLMWHRVISFLPAASKDT